MVAAATDRAPGTNDIAYENIEWAGTPRLSAGLAVEQKLTISASKILGISGSFVRGNRDKPEYIKQASYTRQVEAARSINVLLYDTATKRGWLVDGASALLHLTRAQVSRKPFRRTDSDKGCGRFTCSVFVHPDISGGGDAAAEALVNERNMKHTVLREFESFCEEKTTSQPEANGLNPGTNPSEPKILATPEGKRELYRTTCFKELVSQTWSTLEQIYDRQADPGITNAKQINWRSGNLLEGYEFMDIISTKHTFRRRYVNLKSHGRSWSAFTKRINAITLFAQHYGDLFQPRGDVKLHLCKPWTNVPCDNELLAVPISILKEIKERSWTEGEVDQCSDEIARSYSWSPSLDVFAKCAAGCDHDLKSRVQRFNFASRKAFSEEMTLAHADGVVLFGKNSTIHESSSTTLSPWTLTRMDSSFDDSGLGSSPALSPTTGTSRTESSSSDQVSTSAISTCPVPFMTTCPQGGAQVEQVFMGSLYNEKLEEEEPKAAPNVVCTQPSQVQISTAQTVGNGTSGSHPDDTLVTRDPPNDKKTVFPNFGTKDPSRGKRMRAKQLWHRFTNRLSRGPA